MRTQRVVKLDPILSSVQKLSQGLIAMAFANREFEKSYKSFSISVVGRRASSAH